MKISSNIAQHCAKCSVTKYIPSREHIPDFMNLRGVWGGGVGGAREWGN